MSVRNAVQRAYDGFGRQAGLEKRSGSWHHRSDEVISVTNLQKSQYGPAYYVNQGWYLRQLGDEAYPKPARCHVQCRLDQLLGDADRDRAQRLLDLDSALPDEARSTELAELLGSVLLPLIRRGETVAGLRAMLADGTLDTAPVRGEAFAALGLA